MNRRKYNIRKSLAKTLVSVFVIVVFLLPAITTTRWVSGMLNGSVTDSRKVGDVPTLQVRAVDKNDAPLKPFEEPLITVTFDDGWESVYSKALPIMQIYGIRSSQFVLSGTFDYPSYMSVEQVKSMQAAGHEIGSHTISHAQLTALGDEQLDRELRESKEVLSRHFGPIKDFTSPLGAYDERTLKAIGKYYRSQKNAEGDASSRGNFGINQKSDFTPLNIKSYSIKNTTTIEELKRLIEETRRQNGWLVLTYHQVDYSGGTYSVTPEAFKAHMELVSKTNMRSPTVGQALDSLGVK